MSKSMMRVETAAKAKGLGIEVRRMPQSTRIAIDAAKACKCSVAQIVKSLIFEGEQSGTLLLLLVSGAHEVDLAIAAKIIGERPVRADPSRVRAETGFAIGGVAPIGHLHPIDTWMDTLLFNHELVWAAAGAPDAVFAVSPTALKAAVGALDLPLSDGQVA